MSGSWAQYNDGKGAYSYKQALTGAGASFSLRNPAVLWGEITATVRVKLEAGTNMLAGLVFRRTVDGKCNTHAYFAGLRNSASGYFCGIMETDDGSYWYNKTPGLTTCKYDMTTCHTLLVRAVGGQIEFYVDNQLKATWVDTVPQTAGALGWRRSTGRRASMTSRCMG